MVDDSLKGASFGVDQKNYLMHKNEFINSSIIINIIVNGINRTRDNADSDYYTTDAGSGDYGTETSEAPWIGIYDDALKRNLVDRGFNVDPGYNVDPRFNVEVHQEAQPYQTPDIGRERVYGFDGKPIRQYVNPPPTEA